MTNGGKGELLDRLGAQGEERLLLAHVLQPLLPAVQGENAVVHLCLQVPQQGGKVPGLFGKLRQLLLLLRGEALLPGLGGQAVGVVPGPVDEAGQLLQLLGVKGQDAEGGLLGGGAGGDFAAEAAAEAAVGGIEALLQGGAHGVHGAHRGLKGGTGGVGGHAAQLGQVGIAHGAEQTQGHQGGHHINAQNLLHLF